MLKKTWFITGCATGFGRALAEAALARGDNVVVTDRDGRAVADLGGKYPDTALALGLDVTKAEEVRAGLKAAIDRFEKIDVLVNNAGFAVQAAIEEADMDRVRAMMEVNFYGMIDVIRAALPFLRAQGRGHIMNFASVGGRVSGPLMALYCASKFAVEGLSDGLAAEVADFGIKVTTIEPGAFATGFSAAVIMPEHPLNEYQPLRENMQAMIGDLPMGKSEDLAAALLELADSENPPLKFAGGIDAWGMISDNIAAQIKELEAWKPLSAKANTVAAARLP
jgi:NAD(P)-dependent dehydrogenase (short-subunit alcohol dehydrogenase family)